MEKNTTKKTELKLQNTNTINTMISDDNPEYQIRSSYTPIFSNYNVKKVKNMKKL